MATTAEASQEGRVRLRRAHERLRTASKDLQALVATDPIKGRWQPDAPSSVILAAARLELQRAAADLASCEAQVLGWGAAEPALEVVDDGRLIRVTFADMMRHHGPGSPGGVAHAFKVMERGFPLLDAHGPPPRRRISVTTAFGGPGARDGLELVTRAVTGERFVLDPGLARPELGLARERFVFRLACDGRSVTLVLREGFVTDAFIMLARKERSAEEEARLDVLKQELADRVMASPADEVYDATPGP